MFEKPETTSLVGPLYKKRAHTNSLNKALYETKLISLLYLRGFFDETIEEFQLAANVDQMDQFGDICFKAKMKGIYKPIQVLIQVKYKPRKNILQSYLEKSFCSYLKIRELFDKSNDNLFLKGEFSETECFFVLYTNANIDFPIRGSGDGAISVKLKNLIGTGGTDGLIYLQDEHVKFLCEVAMKNQMISLAKLIAKLLNDDGNFQMLLTDENMRLYHVVLAQKVVKVSDVHPDGHRIATFRREFFDTKEKYLTTFKDTLIKEVQNNQKIKFTDQNITELLSTLHFKVPFAFGNTDLTMRGNDEEIEIKINSLASFICSILEFYNITKKGMIVGPACFLQELDGSVAGAFGNLFVLKKDSSNRVKITDKTEQLGPLAKRLYSKIEKRFPNLHEYELYFDNSQFPKLSFNVSCEDNLVKDFLDRLVLYNNQANVDNMENILKIVKEDYQRDQLKHIQAESDVIFLRYFDQIHKWWMSPKVAPILSRKSDFFKIEDTLMSEINANCMSEMKQYNYTFTDFAVRYLELFGNQLSKKLSIIITENSILTVVKVTQLLKDKTHVVLNFENIAKLQIDDLTALRTELKYTNHDKVLILVCDDIQKEKINALQIFTVRNENMIIVTNQTTYKTVQKYFKADSILNDKKLSLLDLSEELQKTIFETATVIFPGVEEEIPLDLLLQGWPKSAFSHPDVWLAGRLLV